MDKILEQLTMIEADTKGSEVSFAGEIDRVNLAASNRLRILREIKQEAASIITDLTSKIAPLERQQNDLISDIRAKQSLSDKILADLEGKEAKITAEIESKTAAIVELEDKLNKLQKIISSYITEKDSISDSLSNARVQLDMAEMGAEKAKREVEDSAKKVELAKKEIGDISNDKDILNADIRNKRVIVDELTRSIEKLKTAEINTIEKRLAELKK